MAGRQTGRSCITRSILDSVEIPKPSHRFSGSTMSSDSSVTPSTSTKTGNKMAAAARPEVAVSCFEISTLSGIEREIQLLPVWRPVNQRFRCRSMSGHRRFMLTVSH
jgi:hypothetical protein